MRIDHDTLTFQFRMRGDKNWQVFQQPLANLKKNDLTDDETLSEEIHELMYAMDDRTYQEPDNVEYNVSSYWNDIVLPTHEAIYRHHK